MSGDRYYSLTDPVIVSNTGTVHFAPRSSFGDTACGLNTVKYMAHWSDIGPLPRAPYSGSLCGRCYPRGLHPALTTSPGGSLDSGVSGG